MILCRKPAPCGRVPNLTRSLHYDAKSRRISRTGIDDQYRICVVIRRCCSVSRGAAGHCRKQGSDPEASICMEHHAAILAPAKRSRKIQLPSRGVAVLALALALALRHFLYFALVGTACHSRSAFRLGCCLFAGCTLQPLAFCLVFNVLGVHSSILIPAYFSTIFFNP